MIPAISFYDSTGSGTTASGTTATTDTSQVTKNMFLQLLVAQIKNQNPLKPSDGTEFLTELAQFQQLEQGVNSGQDIAAIRTDLETLATAAASSSAKSKT